MRGQETRRKVVFYCKTSLLIKAWIHVITWKCSFAGRKKPSWRRQKVGDKRRVPITQQENHLGSPLGKFLSNQNDVSWKATPPYIQLSYKNIYGRPSDDAATWNYMGFVKKLWMWVYKVNIVVYQTPAANGTV